MILLVLLLIFAGLFLVLFIGCWVYPRAAARMRVSEGKLGALCMLYLLLCFSIYAGWRVECPFCHAGHVDVQGRCRVRGHFSTYLPGWDQMTEQQRSEFTGDPGH